MFASVRSVGLLGIDGYYVDVEVHLALGLQNFDIVGIRFDADRQNNLVIFEKEIGLHGDDDD